MKFIRCFTLLGLMAVAGGGSCAFASDAYEGYQLYKTYCMICHGVEGKGDGPLAMKLGDVRPTDLTDAARMGKHSDKEVFQIIQGTADHAVIDGQVPRWGMAISGPQIESLVAYIRFLHDSPYPVIGTPELGKEVYLNSCAACHGIHGKGDGVMTNVLQMEPADHSNRGDMGEMSNRSLLDVVRDGGKGYMPAWKGILSKKAIRSVVGYIRLLSY
jgi:cbb3-type cytochrome c oxidase subunit III